MRRMSTICSYNDGFLRLRSMSGLHLLTVQRLMKKIQKISYRALGADVIRHVVNCELEDLTLIKITCSSMQSGGSEN